MSQHRRPEGRHRARRPPSNKAPAVVASAVLGAAAAALSTAAASGQGIGAIAAAASTQPPGAEGALGVGGPAPVAAEEPLAGHQLLSAAAAQTRASSIRASRQAKQRQLALVEARRPRWVRPGTGILSSCFCARWGTFHEGIDLAAPKGSPIYAAGDGVVLYAGPQNGYGNVILILHADGDVSVYGHEYRYLVEVGEKVRAGQLIALVGSLGESTGPHLHFEVRRGGANGVRTNPVPWLASRGVTI